MPFQDNLQSSKAAQKPAFGELFGAIDRQDIERVKDLLERGADINEDIGSTPLIWAALSSSREIMLLLIEKGADVNQKNDTVFSYVVWKNYVDVMRALIEHGADINVKNSSGATPLMNAAVCEGEEMVRLLLEKGARVDEKNIFGATALMFSVYHNNLEVVRLLLEHGADPEERNKEGKTVLELAKGFPEARQLIEEVIDRRAAAAAAVEAEKERARQSAVSLRQQQLQKQALRGPRLKAGPSRLKGGP